MLMSSEQWTTIGLVLMVLATGAVSWDVYLSTPLEVRAETLAEIPIEITNWQGKNIAIETDVAEMLDADFHVQRVYQHPIGAILWLYVGYYGTERGGRPEHTPWVCYPSNGWKITRQSVVEIGGAENLRANEIVVERNGETRLVHFWYQSYRRSGMLGDLDQALERLRNRVMDGRADGSLVRISTPIEGPMSESGARVRLMQFAQEIAPLLRAHWPEEADRTSS
jgi:EpsI family protein